MYSNVFFSYVSHRKNFLQSKCTKKILKAKNKTISRREFVNGSEALESLNMTLMQIQMKETRFYFAP